VKSVLQCILIFENSTEKGRVAMSSRLIVTVLLYQVGVATFAAALTYDSSKSNVCA